MRPLPGNANTASNFFSYRIVKLPSHRGVRIGQHLPPNQHHCLHLRLDPLQPLNDCLPLTRQVAVASAASGGPRCAQKRLVLPQPCPALSLADYTQCPTVGSLGRLSQTQRLAHPPCSTAQQAHACWGSESTCCREAAASHRLASSSHGLVLLLLFMP